MMGLCFEANGFERFTGETPVFIETGEITTFARLPTVISRSKSSSNLNLDSRGLPVKRVNLIRTRLSDYSTLTRIVTDNISK